MLRVGKTPEKGAGDGGVSLGGRVMVRRNGEGCLDLRDPEAVRGHDRQAERTFEEPAASQTAPRELQALLDAEVSRLPEKCRAPFVVDVATGREYFTFPGALEYIGTSPAKQVLKALAQGAPEGRLTQEAKASLERLAGWPAATP